MAYHGTTDDLSPQMKDDPNSVAYFKLLEIFTFGSWSKFKPLASSLPPTTEVGILKLKRLSLVSLCYNKKVLTYSELYQALDIPSLQELEDFIVDCFDLELVWGMLDQEKECLLVEKCMGRDANEEIIQEMLGTVKNWRMSIRTTLDAMASSQAQSAVLAQQKEERRRQVSQLCSQVEDFLLKGSRGDSSSSALGGSSEYRSMQYRLEEERLRGKRGRQNDVGRGGGSGKGRF
mgnify:FL=1